MGRLKKKLVYEEVYDEIIRRIESGQWKPGERLPTLEELSAELRVGISSVREAVRILGKQQVLVVLQGSGTFVNERIPEQPQDYVRRLERSSWKQLTEARLVIEPELAFLAAERGSEEQLRSIVECAEAMRRNVQQRKDFLREDIEFHDRIAEASHNAILCQMLRQVSDVLLDSRRQTMRIPGMDEKAASYHYLIAKAIEQRNGVQAKELMKLHIVDMIAELN